MNNKKYLDKVIELLVRGTKMNYENETMVYPFTKNLSSFPFTHFVDYNMSFNFLLPFIKYCGDQFGLTEEEIDYVYLRYVEIILEKIKDGE